MLDFERISFEKKILIENYFFKYGEGSCQHSFVSSYLREHKYGDMFCEKGKYLYVFRSGISTDKERVYFFPMGDVSDKTKIKRAIEEIISDAHEYKASVRFETVTQKANDIIMELFPGKFKSEYDRNLSEYFYSYNKLADLPGRKLKKRRCQAKKFVQKYGGRYGSRIISLEDIEEIREFQEYWFKEKMKESPDIEIEIENEAVQKALDNFEELKMSGIVLYIDGRLKGYTCVVPTSGDVYDFVFEKGDMRIENIHRILSIDTMKLCCRGAKFISQEEDLGHAGLREYKLSYQPDFLLKKYVLTEMID